MRVSSTKKSRYYKYAAIVLLAVFLVSFSLIAVNLYEKNHGKFPVQTTAEKFIEHDGVKYELKDNLETFIVIGIDGKDTDSYKDDVQADFILLLVLDNDAKTVTPIQINRDTVTEMNVLGLGNKRVGTVKQQVALSYNYGSNGNVSCGNTLNAVSKLLNGMKIDHYLSVTMDGVPVFNDLVGGVTVEVLDDMTVDGETLVKGQTVTLMGKQALDYVRARSALEDKTNVARMARQRQYLAALREKTVEKLNADLNFAVEIVEKMSDHIVSDRSVNRLQELLEKITAYEFTETLELEGESSEVKVNDDEKIMEFYPYADSITEIVVKAFYRTSDK